MVNYESVSVLTECSCKGMIALLLKTISISKTLHHNSHFFSAEISMVKQIVAELNFFHPRLTAHWHMPINLPIFCSGSNDEVTHLLVAWPINEHDMLAWVVSGYPGTPADDIRTCFWNCYQDRMFHWYILCLWQTSNSAWYATKMNFTVTPAVKTCGVILNRQKQNVQLRIHYGLENPTEVILPGDRQTMEIGCPGPNLGTHRKHYLNSSCHKGSQE